MNWRFDSVKMSRDTGESEFFFEMGKIFIMEGRILGFNFYFNGWRINFYKFERDEKEEYSRY